MHLFARFPLLRLLIPFIAGVLLSVYYPEVFVFKCFDNVVIFFCVLITALIVLLVIQSFFNIKILISIVVDLSLFSFGYAISYYQDYSEHYDFIGKKTNPDDAYLLIAKPTDIITHKEKFNKLVFEVYRVFDKNERKWQNVCGKIMVLIPAEIQADSFYHPNGFYLLNLRLQENTKIKNPYSFDYTEYLKRQGIYHTAFIKNIHDIKLLNIKKGWSFKDWALYARYSTVQYFKHNKYLDKSSQNIIIAFLTGFDDEMENDIVKSFVYSGTLHILSVSGFHTGLLFLLVMFVFSFIDPYHRRKWTRTILTVLILFFYAFLSGFSAPIIRAVIMLSLVVVQQNFYLDRIAHPLNILSAAAFFVLCINPLYINDAGFLLSFSAMVGLIYFSPKYIFENKMLQSVWDIVSMSIGAQLGTLPFALYFFHGFAFLFIIANLIIIPLSSVIMFVGIASLVPLPFISVLLNYLIQFLIWIISLFYQSNSYYDWIHFNFTDAIILSVLTVGLFISIKEVLNKETHWIKSFNFCVFILSVWLIVHHIQYVHFSWENKVFLYTDKNKSICWIQNGCRIIFNSIDSVSFNYWIKNMLLKNCVNSFTTYSFNYILHDKRKILIARQLKDTVLIKTIRPNILIWDNTKAITWEKIDYPALQKIYWIAGNYIHKKSHNDKIEVIPYKKLIEL